MELAEDYRHTPKYSDIYKLRSETIERVFESFALNLFVWKLFFRFFQK